MCILLTRYRKWTKANTSESGSPPASRLQNDFAYEAAMLGFLVQFLVQTSFFSFSLFVHLNVFFLSLFGWFVKFYWLSFWPWKQICWEINQDQFYVFLFVYFFGWFEATAPSWTSFMCICFCLKYFVLCRLLYLWLWIHVLM